MADMKQLDLGRYTEIVEGSIITKEIFFFVGVRMGVNEL